MRSAPGAFGDLGRLCTWCVWSLRGRCLVPLRLYTWCIWSLRRPIHQVHSSVRRRLITIKSQLISDHTTSPLSMLFYPSSRTVQPFPPVRKKNKSKTYNSFPALQAIGDSLRFSCALFADESLAHFGYFTVWSPVAFRASMSVAHLPRMQSSRACIYPCLASVQVAATNTRPRNPSPLTPF